MKRWIPVCLAILAAAVAGFMVGHLSEARRLGELKRLFRQHVRNDVGALERILETGRANDWKTAQGMLEAALEMSRSLYDSLETDVPFARIAPDADKVEK
jgi:hypothetical protein